MDTIKEILKVLQEIRDEFVKYNKYQEDSMNSVVGLFGPLLAPAHEAMAKKQEKNEEDILDIVIEDEDE